MRHPPLHVTAVSVPDRLDRIPDILLGDHHHCSVVRLHVSSSNQETMRAGISTRFSRVTCHSSALGCCFTSAMNPDPRWAIVAITGRPLSSNVATAFTNALDKHSILPISSIR